MPVHLLDVNILIALAWPNHVHHVRAHAWFATNAGEGWATCPLTQCGFVRISSNPRIIPEARSPHEAIELLRRMVSHPRHIFWTADISVAEEPFIAQYGIIGHRQVTDAYLLALATRRGGRLATFDRAITSLSADAGVTVIEA
jgi:toxin-antitoxin system PIN domain toxin